MSHTLQEIIFRAVSLAAANGERLGVVSSDGHTPLSSQAGDFDSLSDPASLPPGASDRAMQGWWIWLPWADPAEARRIIGSYEPLARTLRHRGPQWEQTTIDALNAGSQYLLLRDDPHQWTAAVYEALTRRLTEVRFGMMTLSAGQTTYVVTEPSVTSRTQIMSIEWAPAGAQAGATRWQPWEDGQRTWNVIADGEQVVIDFGDPALAPNPDRVQVRVKYTRQFDPEAEPWDVDLDWAAWATISVMAGQMRDPDNASDNWNVLAQQAAREVESHRRRILATDGYSTVRRTTIRTGLSGVRGRL